MKNESRPLLDEGFHIVALSAFAVAQPLFDILARSPEFFVAHGAGFLEIGMLAAAVSLGLPLVLYALVKGISALSEPAGKFAYFILVWVLSTASAVVILNRLYGELSSVALIIAAGVLGAVCVVALIRFFSVRRFLSVCGVAALYFPINFLLLGPVSDVFASDSDPKEAIPRVRSNIPVVLVVFDEFNLASLLDRNLGIDAKRFPNLAALADKSWWFRNTAAASNETVKAVPAILTGGVTSGEASLPTASQYPQNLFSWLGKTYRLNVSETVTKICAETCDEGGSDFDQSLFATDIVFIYLHLLLPSSYRADYLPPLDTGWKGFGQHGEGKLNGFFQLAAKRYDANRSQEFKHFIDKVDSEPRTLDFIHILLPHTPYQYLPNGMSYQGNEEEGLVPPNRSWAKSEYLVRLAYQRYLLQLGHTDGLVGELLEKLKAVGKYDEALIIMTADHGISFTPGEPKRFLTEKNVVDVMRIPLFVKLPHQRQGYVSDRPVSNSDVLATIADVLDEPLPWPSDGVSVFATGAPRERTQFDDASDQSWKSVDALRPRVEWQANAFGDAPLRDLSIRGSHDMLLGKNALTVGASEANAKVYWQSGDTGHFNNVDLESAWIPAMLEGSIAGLEAKEVDIAISLNGIIAAVVPTYSKGGEPHHFSALLPYKLYRQGRNDLNLYMVDKGTKDLVAVPSANSAYRIEANGGRERIVAPIGAVHQISQGKASGQVYDIETSESEVRFIGWAVDARYDPSLVDRILMFVDGKFISTERTDRQRPGVAKKLGAQVLMSGFSISVPARVVEEAQAIRFFAVTKDGLASELRVGEKVKEALAKDS
jgi:hypothetical protein